MAGTYDITPFGLTSGNYVITYVDGALAINVINTRNTIYRTQQDDGTSGNGTHMFFGWDDTIPINSVFPPPVMQSGDVGSSDTNNNY